MSRFLPEAAHAKPTPSLSHDRDPARRESSSAGLSPRKSPHFENPNPEPITYLDFVGIRPRKELNQHSTLARIDHRLPEKVRFHWESGAPGETRTPDPLVRSRSMLMSVR
jgi:hypothetical protein